ncbi:TMV resistance protein N-like [Eucalyptus grandis]|uniref:TMV resistance protein N-like n=1 Tax=Eucalyptus grandis TaxID=71139 RepID=UPI00192EFF79|nr:TMV resistance protein N-like [Eucalyptus grandis]
MAVYGEHRSLDGSLPHELTSKTPFLSLKLYVLIGILSFFALSIGLVIYLCIRASGTLEKRQMLTKEMNSQASSGPSPEVFLSFRGADTRYGFTDFLYYGMVEAGILVFRDNESLHVGKRIGHELLQAIENSKIYIPIFSKNYASSHWCLRELAYMVKCTSKSNENKEILPIFLDVEPDDVMLKTNLYRKALSKYQKKFCTEVESWKKALIEVDEIKGWNLKKDGRCIYIEELPHSVGKLQSLVELDLSLTSIGHLPDSIGNLKQLKILRISGIREITRLPSAIGLVEKLEELDARGCYNLTGEILEEIGRLSRLRILDLSNTCISGLPATMSHLSNLQTLKLEKSPKLKQLPELPPNLTCLRWGPKNCWCSSAEEHRYEPEEYWQEQNRAREEYEQEIERHALKEYGIALPLPTRIGALSQ